MIVFILTSNKPCKSIEGVYLKESTAIAEDNRVCPGWQERERAEMKKREGKNISEIGYYMYSPEISIYEREVIEK
ncbi:MAG: hypothetical protein WC022_00245 [Parcubacteria group bacterium]